MEKMKSVHLEQCTVTSSAAHSWDMYLILACRIQVAGPLQGLILDVSWILHLYLWAASPQVVTILWWRHSHNNQHPSDHACPLKTRRNSIRRRYQQLVSWKGPLIYTVQVVDHLDYSKCHAESRAFVSLYFIDIWLLLISGAEFSRTSSITLDTPSSPGRFQGQRDLLVVLTIWQKGRCRGYAPCFYFSFFPQQRLLTLKAPFFSFFFNISIMHPDAKTLRATKQTKQLHSQTN